MRIDAEGGGDVQEEERNKCASFVEIASCSTNPSTKTRTHVTRRQPLGRAGWWSLVGLAWRPCPLMHAHAPRARATRPDAAPAAP